MRPISGSMRGAARVLERQQPERPGQQGHGEPHGRHRPARATVSHHSQDAPRRDPGRPARPGTGSPAARASPPRSRVRVRSMPASSAWVTHSQQLQADDIQGTVGRRTAPVRGRGATPWSCPPLWVAAHRVPCGRSSQGTLRSSRRPCANIWSAHHRDSQQRHARNDPHDPDRPRPLSARTSATSPSSPMSTTARPPSSTPSSSRPARSGPTRSSPSG